MPENPPWQPEQHRLRRQQWQKQQQQWQQQLRGHLSAAGADQQQELRDQQVRAERRAQLEEPFASADAAAGELRLKYGAGRLTEEELDARLEELTVQDAAGQFWRPGYNPGSWYRYDTDHWVADAPPGRRISVSRTAVGGGGAPALWSPAPAAAEETTHPVLAAAVFLTLFFAAGFAGVMLLRAFGLDSPVALGVVAVIALAIAISQAWRVYRPR